jgi:hypothetical protein
MVGPLTKPNSDGELSHKERNDDLICLGFVMVPLYCFYIASIIAPSNYTFVLLLEGLLFFAVPMVISTIGFGKNRSLEHEIQLQLLLLLFGFCTISLLLSAFYSLNILLGFPVVVILSVIYFLFRHPLYKDRIIYYWVSYVDKGLTDEKSIENE